MKKMLIFVVFFCVLSIFSNNIVYASEQNIKYEVQGNTYTKKDLIEVIEKNYNKSIIENTLIIEEDTVCAEFKDCTTSETIAFVIGANK